MGERCIISWISYGLKLGISWKFIFCFLYILLILCVTHVSKKYYHGTGADKLFSQHKVGLVSVYWENVVSDHGVDTV